MKLICILLLALIVCAGAKKHARLAVKDPKTFVLLEDDVEKINANNEKAETIFADANTGRDPYPQIIKDSFHVTIEPKSLLLADSYFQGDLDVYLNSNALWVFTGQDKTTYRADNIVSIDLQTLVAETDNVQENTCCDNIRPVFRDTNKDGIFCFEVNTVENTWTLCSQAALQQELVETFRQQLVLHVIRANGNLLSNAIILTDPLLDNPDSWSWLNQGQWQHQCSSGSFQSPIQIDTSKVAEDSDFQLTWNYNNITNQDATVQFNGREVEVNGNFGSISLALKDSQGSVYDLNAHKITFKFDPEHSIKDDNELPRDFVGEMLVHHTSPQGVRAIVSFLLVDDRKAMKNEFFEQLAAYNWKHEAGYFDELEDKPDLNQIVFGGASDFYDKSFYFYVGSETQPPCKEGVLRIVFETPIGVLPSQLKPLMQQNFDNLRFPNGNSRDRQLVGKRTVFYHKDGQSLDLPLDIIQTKNRVMDALSQQVQKDQGHFVQTTQKKTYLSYVPEATEDISLENERVQIETVPEDQISEAQKEELLAGAVLEDSDDDDDDEDDDDEEEESNDESESESEEERRRDRKTVHKRR